MTLWIDWIAVDCRDARKVAAFWREALDYEVEYSSDEDRRPGSSAGAVPPVFDPDPEVEILLSPRNHRNARLLFIEVPEPKTLKNRLHLDLRSHDQEAEARRLEALGAKRVDIGQGDVTWIVMADPEGNEFCILRDPKPEEMNDLFYEQDV